MVIRLRHWLQNCRDYMSAEQDIMNSDPLVSVIIIFFNAENFIDEAIESVFAQTYENWELLLVDDGSTDASTKIAKRFAARDPNKVFYHEHPYHQNLGMSASRNLGIKYARGEFIALLDADDVWLPLKLEKQSSILKLQPKVAMVYGKTEYWWSWTGIPQDRLRDRVQEHGIPGDVLVKPIKLLCLYLQGKAAVPCINSILIRADILKLIAGFEEEFRDLYEDQVLYAKVCLEAPVFVSNECWDRYRQHANASCSVAERTGRVYSARSNFLDWLGEYMLKQGIQDREVWQAFRRAKWQSSQLTWLNASARPQRWVRWTKKWLLRLDEKILPAQIRNWLWS